MIAFLGLGAAGSNIADEAKKEGFEGFAINYSQKDLDSLEHIMEEDRLKLVGSEGVGKNRQEAIRLITKNWERATSFLQENLASPYIEVVVVCFSTGGGSGSGMAPILLEILMNEMPEKTFVAVPILPDLSEVVVNQMNSIRTCEELSKLALCVFPLDNEKVKGQPGAQGKNRLYETANRNLVYLFKRLEGYTEKHSKHGVMDQKDLRAILSTKGVGLIAETDLAKLVDVQHVTEKGVARAVQASWDESIFAPISYRSILRAGFIFDGQEALMDALRLPVVFSEFENGMPMDLFEGYYHEEKGTVLSVLSGLSWFNERMKKSEALVKARQAQGVVEESTYNSNLEDVALNIRKPVKSKKKRGSASDIISKYIR